MKDFPVIAAQRLHLNPQRLYPVEISQYPRSSLLDSGLCMVPGRPYQNAVDAAQKLKADFVIYGAVMVNLGLESIPLKHAWIKADHKYYDPSFQLGSGVGVYVESYLSLMEIPMVGFDAFCTRHFGLSSDVIAPDIDAFRKLPVFSDFFSNTLDVARAFVESNCSTNLST